MNQGPRFFLYARKSTDVEDKQVMSIDSQLAELREFAARERLTVVGEFVEKRSAKQPGRPGFDDMLERIKAGEASAILSWHPDRLARNSMDGGHIIYLLDQGILSTLKFPTTWFENTPQGKFTLSMAFVQSKYYVDSLGENVRRGIREKMRRGDYPGRAPFGYLNDYRVKHIIADRERAPLVKEAFRRYATGKETLDTLRKWFGSQGVRAPSGKLVGASFVSALLSNPIYYGHYLWKGEVHEGRHEPIISKVLFDRVQTVINRRWRWSPGKQAVAGKPFLGLLHCQECGGAITAEVQKGHTYYRCTKKGKITGRWCGQPYIREEALDAEISGLLKLYDMPESVAHAMLERLEAERKQSTKSYGKAEAVKHTEIETVTAKLQRLQDAFLDGDLDREAFLAAKARLTSEKKTLEEQLALLSRGGNYWLEPMRNWIITAKNAGFTAISGSFTEKKALAQEIFGSNLVLDNKRACGRAVNPWSLMTDNELSSQMVGLTGHGPNLL